MPVFYFLRYIGERKKGPKPLVMRATNLPVDLLACCLPCCDAFYIDVGELPND